MTTRTSDYYYDEGRQARKNRLNLEDCPYTKYTVLVVDGAAARAAWIEGWMDQVEDEAIDQQEQEHGRT